ncbi:ATP-binding protein [Bifidobacterium scaligerum]|nr:ATP-binding protein [Bifidobacterium scaligerum]
MSARNDTIAIMGTRTDAAYRTVDGQDGHTSSPHISDSSGDRAATADRRTVTDNANHGTDHDAEPNATVLTFQYAQQSFASAGLTWTADRLKSSFPSAAGSSNDSAPLDLLLADQCPFMTKAVVFDGDDKNIIRERHTFTGSVLRQLNEASVLLAKLNSGRYPATALRESLVNALEHRDYTYSGPTLINIFDSRLEIVSLGSLADGMAINDLLNGVCQPRNPRLAVTFADLNLAENCGTGMQRIMDSYAGNDISPQLRVGPTSVAIVLPSVIHAETSDDNGTSPSDAPSKTPAKQTSEQGTHAKLYSFPAIQRMTDYIPDALAGARICGCAPLQMVTLGSYGLELPTPIDTTSGEASQENAIDTALINHANETLEQITLNLLASSGVSLSRKTIEQQLGLSRDQAAHLLRQLELDGKIERHGRSRATTYSLASQA